MLFYALCLQVQGYVPRYASASSPPGMLQCLSKSDANIHQNVVNANSKPPSDADSSGPKHRSKARRSLQRYNMDIASVTAAASAIKDGILLLAAALSFPFEFPAFLSLSSLLELWSIPDPLLWLELCTDSALAI